MNCNEMVVLITGALSGIGKFTAELLSSKGYKVYGTSRKSNNLCTYKFLYLDVTDKKSIDKCIDTIIQEEGRLDILINNAGFA